MQAVILVGGEGTRLRPLTSLRPKPVVTLVDRPFIVHMLDWLIGHGVDDVIMSCGFLPDQIEAELGDGSGLGISLRFVTEPEPRGTAGALKYAEEFLHDRFLMLNGDVLTDIDLGAQLAQHERTGATGTLALVPVADPSSYGLVRLHEDQSVKGFLEKPRPEQIDTNLISAGAYVLERSVLDLIEPDRNVSIEREIWPALVGNGLYGFAADHAYWMDIGTPDRYLRGTFDILEGRVQTAVRAKLGEHGTSIDPTARVDGTVVAPAIVGANAVIERDAFVGSVAVVAEDAVIGEGAIVENAIVLAGARIGAGAQLRDCVIAPGAVIGDRTIVGGEAVIGDGVRVGADNQLDRGIRVFPGTEIPDGAIRF